MKLEIIKKNKQWYWRIKSRNGKILCHSETYSSRSKAVKTVNSIKKFLNK